MHFLINLLSKLYFKHSFYNTSYLINQIKNVTRLTNTNLFENIFINIIYILSL